MMVFTLYFVIYRVKFKYVTESNCKFLGLQLRFSSTCIVMYRVNFTYVTENNLCISRIAMAVHYLVHFNVSS